MSNKLKIIIELQNSIELDNLNYKNIHFDKVLSLSISWWDRCTSNLSRENADNEQNDQFKMFGSLNQERKS